MSTDPPTAHQDTPTRPIGEALHILDTTIELLQNKTSEIQERLTDVLEPPHPAPNQNIAVGPQAGETTGSQGTLTETLKSKNRQIQTAINALDDILNRLEL